MIFNHYFSIHFHNHSFIYQTYFESYPVHPHPHNHFNDEINVLLFFHVFLVNILC